MMNIYGIAENSMNLLLNTFSQYPQIEKAILFGSRAKGNYKRGSDIDIAIKGEQCSAELALQLQSYINEELPIPYKVDIINYQTLNHKELKDHIDRAGKIIYHK